MTYTVFSLNDQSGSIKYVGVTKQSLRKRLQDLQSGSVNSTTAQYSQPVAVWLREVYAKFKQPAVTVHGVFETRNEAIKLKNTVIVRNSSVLNAYSKPLKGFKL
jgi:predicted GIY-YIG superfamily endonuclease